MNSSFLLVFSKNQMPEYSVLHESMMKSREAF